MNLKSTVTAIALMCLPLMASAQTYVVDNIFGKDSVVFATGIKDKTVSAGYGAGKNAAKKVKIDTVLVPNGASVRLKEVKKDSLRLLNLLVEEVPVVYGRNTYYTFASNLKLSDKNPAGMVDKLTARLKNHKSIDIHGKDRWLFSRWLVLAILILGFAGVSLTILKGYIGRLILVISLILMDVYIFMIGVDTATWFINSNLTSENFSLACVGLFLANFALTIRIIVSLFKEGEPGSTIFAVLLILMGLPVLGLGYLVVFSVAMALLFKYWWIGAVLVGLLILLCVKPMSKEEWAHWERDKEGRNRRMEEQKRQEAFEKSKNKFEGLLGEDD